MALIGKIRQHGWILIVAMTLALGGFILMDIVSNSSRYSAADINTMGKVNGKTITREEFDRYESIVYNGAAGDAYQRRQTIWNYFTEGALVNQEAEKLGLGVGKEELLDLQFGTTNISPIIQQRFGSQDGQLNVQALQQVKGFIDNNNFPDPRTKVFWAEQEKEIIADRVKTKLMTLVSKSVYTPTWQAEMAFRENNERIDFLYTRVPYDKVPESEVQVTDEDYKAYLKEHAKQYYNQEETRIVDFVAIDVVPTSADSAAARTAVEKLVESMRAATNDSSFVTANQGTIDGAYKKKDALPLAIADQLVSGAVGSVVGPYMDGGQWSIAKIIDRKSVPDSVKARHILLKEPTSTRVDSLKKVIESGQGKFDEIAKVMGTDGTKEKGGDLGWFASGQMVPEFNDLCFLKAEQGKLYTVQTQFGWHLIEVTGKKFLKNEPGVKYAIVSQRIVPSETTQQAAKDKAIVLSTQAKTGADLAAMAAQQGLQVQSSSALRPNDYFFGSLGQGNTAREIIRWAFNKETAKDKVSKEYFTFSDENGGYFDSKYVVTTLKTINPKGEATVEGVRTQIEALVKNKKKADAIKAKLGSADIAAAASQYGVAVDTARGASMMQPSLNNGGMEPRVVGTAFSLANGAVSKPIEGNAGVYIVKAIMDKPAAQLPPDLTLFRKQVASGASNSVKTSLMRAWKKASDIEDNRSRFF